MAGIHFSEDVIAPARTNVDHGGVYSIRSRRQSIPETDSQSINSDVEDLKHHGDLKERQEFKGWALLWLSWQATGLIAVLKFQTLLNDF